MYQVRNVGTKNRGRKKGMTGMGGERLLEVQRKQTHWHVLCLRPTAARCVGTVVDRKKEKQAMPLRPMTMETRCCKVFFPIYSKKKPAEDTLVPSLWGTREKTLVFLGLFVHAAVRGGTCASTLKIVNTLIKNSSRDDRPSIST